MAKHIGLVVFPNGDVRYLVWNAFCDMAWAELFEVRAKAEEAWDGYDFGQYDPFAIDTAPAGDDEIVAMFTWADDIGRPGERPFFFTRASRLSSVITGPRSLDDAIDDNEGQKEFLSAVTVKTPAALEFFEMFLNGREWSAINPLPAFVAGLMANYRPIRQDRGGTAVMRGNGQLPPS